MLYGTIFAIVLAASFLFAMLGLGGGMVYVPVLKWAGFPVREVAIPLGLLLNGLNTLLALIPYARQRLVDWKGGSAMAAAALVMAPLGALSTRYVPVRLLLACFAGGVVVAALRTLIVARQPEPTEQMSLRRRWVIGGFVGGFAGFIGGMLGLGGGFIIAPILMWMGYRTKEAAATTAFVVTFSSFSGYLGHVAEGHFALVPTVIVVIAVLIGSQTGAIAMSTRMPPRLIKKIYALTLLAIAVKLVAEVL
ncbi:MAG TPA: sulfite exporter TauE/SafE family protein [Gemmatimonadaceae bacterium]|nr:sulfite exporter TauE/SafE family protein [Gemmatimonadaceae bacterium]